MTTHLPLAALLAVATQAIAVTVSLVIATWVLGGMLLRTGGAATTVVGLLLGLLGYPLGLLLALLGTPLWLAGHWHYALRHHTYKSPLARRVFLDVLPPWADPTRDWSIPTTTPDHDH